MMGNFDCNCFLGEWPFRRFYRGGVEGLKKIHEKAGVSDGWVSSLRSVFYNDPMEAEELLADEIAGTDYGQIMGANPLLPAAVESVYEAYRRWGIRGVRIYPGYHGYRLDDSRLASLAGLLEELRLPLMVTMRLEDERLNYLITPRTVTPEEQRALPALYPRLRLIYTGMQAYEVTGLSETFAQNKNLFAETSFFKSPCTVFEDVLKAVSAGQILYGSGYPLNCLQSTLIALEKADIPEEEKRKILRENTRIISDFTERKQ